VGFPGRLPSLVVLLAALPCAARGEGLAVRTYTVADGLGHDHLQRIVQDSRGFLWFCTSDGLSRFDGYRFVTYGVEQGLPHPAINDLLEASDGSYWVATNGGGVARFDRSLDTTVSSRTRPAFTVYRLGEDGRTNCVNALWQDRAGTLWAGADGGLFRLEGPAESSAFQPVGLGPLPNGSDPIAIWTIAGDETGSLWLATSYGLYRRQAEGRVKRYTRQDGLPDDVVRALLRDKAGTLWAGTGKGLCRLAPDVRRGVPIVDHTYTTKDGLAGNSILSLRQSGDGRLWVGTLDSGLSEFDGQRFRSYSRSEGLSDEAITTLLQDRDGNLWAGTSARGAMRIRLGGLTTYGVADGLGSPRVMSVLETPEGKLCVVTYDPHGDWINVFDGQRFRAFRPGLPRSVDYYGWGWFQIDFEDSHGQWWIPSGEGLFRFPRLTRLEDLARARPEAVFTRRDGLSSDDVFRVFEDAHGDVWIGTNAPDSAQAGLARWERSRGRIRRYGKDDGLGGLVAPMAFAEDRAGDIWIGADEGGLARYRDGRFTVFAQADGLPAGLIRALLLDRSGGLWVATDGGLASIADPTAERPRFTVRTTADGLASNKTLSLTEDLQGRIYVGSGRGIDRLDPTTGRIVHSSAADGLGNNVVRVAFRDRSGGLWFGTEEGVSRLVPRPEAEAVAPAVLIGGVRVFDRSQPVADLGEDEVAGLRLRPDENQIQIDFFGLSFRPGETLRYRYRLESADRDWSAPTEQRTVHYASLAPGVYRFLVQAMGPDGTFSARPAAVVFTILPPVWRQRWFLASAAILAGLAVYSLHRYRVSRLLELEATRARIATDLHDDVGSSLSQLSILTELVRRQVGSDPEVHEPLARIARISSESIDAMSDIVWAINPRKDQLRDLAQRSRRFAGDALTSRGMALRFRVPASEGLKLDPETRRQVFLILKEAVNNIARHSACREADIELRLEGGSLVLSLTDDGKGFEPVRAAEGNGLPSMRRRAESLGGRLEVGSAPGKGARVVLTVPLGRRHRTDPPA